MKAHYASNVADYKIASMYEGRQQRIQEFVDWTGKHITGDEKGQAQVFIDRLFQAFGRKGAQEVGGAFEERIKQFFDETKKTSFADYVWKGVVLFEMKKRGADLAKHRQQAFDYWTHIAPGRPKYVVLCNFDEFWVYDFNNQIYTPKDKVALCDLPKNWGPLAFLFPTNEQPVFGNDREKVTREAADKLATLFRKLMARRVERDLAQRFVLQSMIAMFAEDIDLLPRYMFTSLVTQCEKPADSYDLLGGLFEAMNTPGGVEGGRYKGVKFFNGGIFAKPAKVELYPDELLQLRGNDGKLFGATQSDWSKVSPEIFGAIFQHSMDAKDRHAFGAHFTSPLDIMKIVKPTISDPWKEAIESAKSAKKLNDLLERLTQLLVLDPACGSGNFVYMAYREMKRLETRIRERLATEFPDFAAPLIHVNAKQFYGLDVNPFAIELAKVTMMIGRKLAIEELHIGDEAALPLANLDANFLTTDALITRTPDGGAIKTPWPKAHVIIGNPPFLGAKRLKPEHGADYANALRKLYPDVPGMADFCVYWIRRAHDHLPACTTADHFAGRAGLVGTQNVRNNQSRVGGLDHVVKTGTIVDAVDNQPWSGDANVHVSITNWMKTQDTAILPKKRLLWQKVQPIVGAKHKPGHRADKDYELQSEECSEINSSLSGETDVAGAGPLACNCRPKRCFNGQMLGHEGFLLTADRRAQIIRKDPRSAEVILPYINGLEALTEGRPDRFVLDFGTRNQLEASGYQGAFEWVKDHVLADRERKAKEGADADGNLRSHHKAFLSRWWQLSFGRPELINAVSGLSRYLACPYVTKRPVVFFISSQIRPSNLIQAFAFEDDYSYGILQSCAHWLWFKTKCGKLTERLRYSGDSVFDTFPWPQSPTKKQIDAVAQAGREIRRVRADALKTLSGGLRGLYRTLELPGKHPLKDAHAALDQAVMEAYGFSAKKDLLGQLLELNHAVAAKENVGEPVTAPGIPATYGQDTSSLITDDCIRP